MKGNIRAAGIGVDACVEMGMQCASMRLREIERVVTRHYDSYLERIGVTATQLPLLAMIFIHVSASPRELAEEMGLQRSTLSRNLAVLRRKGLVTSRSAEGPVPSAITLTAKGQGVLRKAVLAWRRAHEELDRRMALPEIDTALRSLEALADRLRSSHGISP